ncbi:peptidase U62 modulator of DNA gyrase [Ammonifex degensii KC4]|uniref:Peptidase U62 modulator of DNA gyrase n=1 Tax=Ammonifex degensii (strain DSM 10501 / KC4) TaxID=429009 RepID=C9RC31_AMMDK|nr:TldD/PmbA family protein [Ammonifex degensii]ACX51808.1 peptidase U62 modulator of DNA gyrase [Ammonifex degensii KC4]
MDLLAVVAAAVAEGKKVGAEEIEAFAVAGTTLQIEVRHGQVETLEQAQETGLGVRVLKGKRFGFAFGTDLSPQGVKETVERAVAACQLAAPDPYNLLPAPSTAHASPELCDTRLAETPVEEKIALARSMEEAAFSFDPRVKIVETATYQEELSEVALANSLGISGSYRGTVCGLYLSLAAEADGQSETGYALKYSRFLRELDPRALGEEAARRAVGLLGARGVKTAAVPVVFDPYVAADFVGLLAPALTAEAVQRGRSLFAGKLGEEVATSKVTLLDDGRLPGGIRTAPFDGEGVPTQRTVLIEKGVLKQYLYDTRTAAREGKTSTGNAVRGGFRGQPTVGPTNFYLEPGGQSPEEIIRQVPEGFYLTEVLGMHTANPISGDFSVGAVGFWIKEGELAFPVRGVTVAGNIKNLLQHIDAVGSDLRFFGGRGAPTFRVSELKVSGH